MLAGRLDRYMEYMQITGLYVEARRLLVENVEDKIFGGVTKKWFVPTT